MEVVIQIICASLALMVISDKIPFHQKGHCERIVLHNLRLWVRFQLRKYFFNNRIIDFPFFIVILDIDVHVLARLLQFRHNSEKYRPAFLNPHFLRRFLLYLQKICLSTASGTGAVFREDVIGMMPLLVFFYFLIFQTLLYLMICSQGLQFICVFSG